MRGKFIVIEGTDGSGKGTQVDLLVERFKKEGLPVEVIDFPQYGKPSCIFVEKYLRGEYGTAEEVGPYRGSLFYALDRYDKSFEVKKLLSEGVNIVANRYVSANMGHQAGKIDNLSDRDKYLEWLHHLEYELCDIPKPDQTIFLFVPPEIGQKLVDQKESREYTKGKKRDIHEADLNHLKKASEAYFYVAEKYGWTTINCTKDGEMLSRGVIHNLIFESVKSHNQ
jgi:dTMP kinase